MEPIDLRPKSNRKIFILATLIVSTLLITTLAQFIVNRPTGSVEDTAQTSNLLFTIQKDQTSKSRLKLLEVKKVTTSKVSSRSRSDQYFLTLISDGKEAYKTTFGINETTSEYIDPKTKQFRTVSTSSLTPVEISTPYVKPGVKIIVTNERHQVILDQIVDTFKN